MPNLLSHMSNSKNQSNRKKWADHIASGVDNTQTVSEISLCIIFIHCFLGSSVQRMLTAKCHWCQFLLVWLGSVNATRRQLYTHIQCKQWSSLMQAPSTMNLYTLSIAYIHVHLLYMVHVWIGCMKFAPKSAWCIQILKRASQKAKISWDGSWAIGYAPLP